MGDAGENLQERKNTRVSVSSLSAYRSVYNDCKRLHSMAELLRYIVFILIPAGIVQVRRCTQKEIVRPTLTLVKFLLSVLVFTINLPAAVVIFCYVHVPLFGAFLYLHFIIEANNVWKMIVFDVMFLAPFFTIGSLALTDILRLPLSSSWIIVCCFILPLVYFIGWVTIVHYFVNKKLGCKYGIWSWPGQICSIDLKVPKLCLFYLHYPVMFLNILLAIWWVIAATFPFPLIFIVCYFTELQNNEYKNTLLWPNKHILASEAILIAALFLYSGFPAHYVVLGSVVGCVCFVSYNYDIYDGKKTKQKDDGY